MSKAAEKVPFKEGRMIEEAAKALKYKEFSKPHFAQIGIVRGFSAASVWAVTATPRGRAQAHRAREARKTALFAPTQVKTCMASLDL